MSVRSLFLLLVLAATSSSAFAETASQPPIPVDTFTDIPDPVHGSCVGNLSVTTCLGGDGLLYTYRHRNGLGLPVSTPLSTVVAGPGHAWPTMSP